MWVRAAANCSFCRLFVRRLSLSSSTTCCHSNKMKYHVIIPFLFLLQESHVTSYSCHVTSALVTMTTLLTTSAALKCQECREYRGPPISKTRQENLMSCEEEVMRTCAQNDTICYDLRVSYSGKRGNSTLHEMGCGTRVMSCEPYRKISRMSECTITRCDDECETEIVNTARGSAHMLLAPLIALLVATL